ncbi:MAG: ethanolamine utilization protein EutN [Candidatus Synoicihabitans palmerolidicus]|nr:ethanolamine utilization protein EutN [Candidatus Synoicihabitans palmerolidicus]
MILARIDGILITAACHPSLQGRRNVICQPLNAAGAAVGAPVIALDPFSSGLHQHVLVSTDGSQTRTMVRDPSSPLRNFVLGIVDTDTTPN